MNIVQNKSVGIHSITVTLDLFEMQALANLLDEVESMHFNAEHAMSIRKVCVLLSKLIIDVPSVGKVDRELFGDLEAETDTDPCCVADGHNIVFEGTHTECANWITSQKNDIHYFIESIYVVVDNTGDQVHRGTEEECDYYISCKSVPSDYVKVKEINYNKPLGNINLKKFKT